jgi:hypothetical protein
MVADVGVDIGVDRVVVVEGERREGGGITVVEGGGWLFACFKLELSTVSSSADNGRSRPSAITVNGALPYRHHTDKLCPLRLTVRSW